MSDGVNYDVVPDLPPLNTTAQAAPAPYTEYSRTTYVLRQSGLVQMPVAGPPGSSSRIVRLHAPTAQKVVLWAAQRIGAKPVLPDRNTGSDNEVWAGEGIGGAVCGKLPSGDDVWSVLGWYRYFLINCPGDDDPILIGGTPIDVTGALSRQITAQDFSTALVGPVPPITGAGGYGGIQASMPPLPGVVNY